MPGPGKFSVPTFLFVFLSQIPAFMLEFPVFHACSCAIRPTKDAFPPSVRPSRPPEGRKTKRSPAARGCASCASLNFFERPIKGSTASFLLFPFPCGMIISYLGERGLGQHVVRTHAKFSPFCPLCQPENCKLIPNMVYSARL